MPSSPQTQEQIAARRALRRQRRARRCRLVVGLGACALVALAVGVVLGRSGEGPATAALTPIARAADRTPVKRTPAQASPVAPTRSRLGCGKPVTLAFGGDIHFESPIRERLAASPAASVSRRPTGP